MLKRYLFILCSLFLLCEHLSAISLRVATCNLANYLCANRMIEVGGRFIFRKDWPKPEVEKALIRETICKVCPDVLAIQEIGGAKEGYLEEFLRDLMIDGLNYPYAVVMQGAYDQKRHLAFVSKYPITALFHTDLTFNYLGQPKNVLRGLLQVILGGGHNKLNLFNLHLKSKSRSRKIDRDWELYREGELDAIKDRMLEVLEESRYQYILVGDLNTLPEATSIVNLCEGYSEGSFLQVIPCQDSRGQQWTHYWKKKNVRSRFDYIMLSPTLNRLNRGLTGQIYDEFTSGSDHRMVYADIEIPDGIIN